MSVVFRGLSHGKKRNVWSNLAPLDPVYGPPHHFLSEIAGGPCFNLPELSRYEEGQLLLFLSICIPPVG